MLEALLGFSTNSRSLLVPATEWHSSLPASWLPEDSDATLQVTSGGKWWEVAESLGIKDDICGADHALKLVYMR